MPEFKLFCINNNKQEAVYYYNNEDNELLDCNKSRVIAKDTGNKPSRKIVPYVSPVSPGKKKGEANFKTKIQLGLSCNYNCSYCCQCGSSSPKEVGISLDELVALVPDSGGNQRTFEFWGGEPLLYWDILVPLAEKIRNRFPDAFFYMATNGSLLSYDKNEWLDKLGFGVSVSHDGPGQWQRGGNPLVENRDAVIHLFNLLNNKGRFSFNPVLTKLNPSRQVINNWFLEEIGHNHFCLGEGSLIHPTNVDNLEAYLVTQEERTDFQRRSLREIRYNTYPNMSISKGKIKSFLCGIKTNRDWSVLGQSCLLDSEGVLVVDIKGNVLGCQNFSMEDTLFTGQSLKIGTLSNLANVKLDLFTTWRLSPSCKNCLLAQVCRGGCPFIPQKLSALACNHSFSDNISIFAYVIEMLTGYIPYYVEGSSLEERKYLFGIERHGDTKELFAQ